MVAYEFVATSGCTLGITAETGTGTIVVAVEGPVDITVTRRIQDADPSAGVTLRPGTPRLLGRRCGSRGRQ